MLFDKTLLDTEKELKKKYKQALEDTLADIKDLWDKLQKESADGVIRPNDLYRYNRYFQVKNNLNERLKRLGLSEDKIYKRKLSAKIKYYHKRNYNEKQIVKSNNLIAHKYLE